MYMIMAMNYTPASSPSCIYKYHWTLVISTLAPCIQDPFSPSERIWGGHGIRVLSQSDIHEWSVLDDLSVEVGATMCDLTKPLLGGKQCFLGAAMSWPYWERTMTRLENWLLVDLGHGPARVDLRFGLVAIRDRREYEVSERILEKEISE
jgi:hypothetical protein